MCAAHTGYPWPLCSWKAKYGWMDVSGAKLKKFLADQMLEASALREFSLMNDRACHQTGSHRAFEDRDGTVRAAGLFRRRRRSQDGAVTFPSSWLDGRASRPALTAYAGSTARKG